MELVLPNIWNEAARKMRLRTSGKPVSFGGLMRLWWNWQTRYFEVVVGQPVQVQVLLSAPFFLRKTPVKPSFAQTLHRFLADFLTSG